MFVVFSFIHLLLSGRAGAFSFACSFVHSLARSRVYIWDLCRCHKMPTRKVHTFHLCVTHRTENEKEKFEMNSTTIIVVIISGSSSSSPISHCVWWALAPAICIDEDLDDKRCVVQWTASAVADQCRKIFMTIIILLLCTSSRAVQSNRQIYVNLRAAQ